MTAYEFGSLTKEEKLRTLDATLMLITPGMSYGHLLRLAGENRERLGTHKDAPGLLRNRFLLVDEDENIVYDALLSLVSSHGLDSPRVRKTMYFVWAWRDLRLRRFICECVADEHGRWRVDELNNKGNSVFFEQWFKGSSPGKARSNIERFLVEAGIYDKKTGSVHLELSDGWLADAVQAAAQHEPDVDIRTAMVSDPLGYLFTADLHGLVNTSKASAASARALPEGELGSSDWLFETGKVSAPLLSTHDWRVHEPVTGREGTVVATIDQVLHERAAVSHQLLERLAADALLAQGISPHATALIDMLFARDGISVIMEMKSCHAGNLRSQVRRGVSQLFEYRYLHRDALSEKTMLVLVLETQPSGRNAWLLGYLDWLGVTAIWKDERHAFAMEGRVPAALRGIARGAE